MPTHCVVDARPWSDRQSEHLEVGAEPPGRQPVRQQRAVAGQPLLDPGMHHTPSGGVAGRGVPFPTVDDARHVAAPPATRRRGEHTSCRSRSAASSVQPGVGRTPPRHRRDRRRHRHRRRRHVADADQLTDGDHERRQGRPPAIGCTPRTSSQRGAVDCVGERLAAIGGRELEPARRRGEHRHRRRPAPRSAAPVGDRAPRDGSWAIATRAVARCPTGSTNAEGGSSMPSIGTRRDRAIGERSRRGRERDRDRQRSNRSRRPRRSVRQRRRPNRRGGRRRRSAPARASRRRPCPTVAAGAPPARCDGTCQRSSAATNQSRPGDPSHGSTAPHGVTSARHDPPATPVVIIARSSAGIIRSSERSVQ